MERKFPLDEKSLKGFHRFNERGLLWDELSEMNRAMIAYAIALRSGYTRVVPTCPWCGLPCYILKSLDSLQTMGKVVEVCEDCCKAYREDTYGMVSLLALEESEGGAITCGW